jgi:hypothetical protein
MSELSARWLGILMVDKPIANGGVCVCASYKVTLASRQAGLIAEAKSLISCRSSASVRVPRSRSDCGDQFQDPVVRRDLWHTRDTRDIQVRAMYYLPFF